MPDILHNFVRWLTDVHSPRDIAIRVIIVLVATLVAAFVTLQAIGDLFFSSDQQCFPTARPDVYDCEPVEYP